MLIDLNHSALMDQVYRRQRYLYDATRKFYLLGRDTLIEDLAPPPGGRILEIGCGTGRNLIATALRYPSAECFGIDISTAMLETARRSARRIKLQDRIHLALGDATRLAPWPIFGVKRFDRLFMSYTLSMIPGWQQAITEALDVLAPGGRLHIVDFGGQVELPAWFRIALYRSLTLFHVQPRLDLADELRSRCERGGLSAEVQSLYRGYATYAVVERTRDA
jgi:S-adenosylmethionine-diacylgycerolhomoserine-N-methlytransferase